MGRTSTGQIIAVVALFFVLATLSPAVGDFTAEAPLPEPMTERSLALSVGNHSLGGYHIATGDWWEAERPFTVSLSDWDGDGVLNNADDHPLDPALPASGTLSGASCVVPLVNCVSETDLTPFEPTPVPILTQGSPAMSLDWGDVDGDGDLDLAVGNNGAPNALYLNHGNGLDSTPAWTSSDSLVSMDVAWGDVDGDGDLDLAVANFEGPVQVFRNNQGTLSSSAVWTYLHGGTSTSSRVTSLEWGDVDGDGDLDLVLGILDEGIYLFRNSGSSLSWGSAWSGGSNESIMDVKLADVDGDGDLDLFEAVSGGVNSVYTNNGGTFSSVAVWQSPGSLATRSLALGDIDGDGDIDMVVGNHGEVNQLFRNGGSGLSSSAVWSSAESEDTMDVRLGDVDGDGDLDLLESNAGNPDHIRIFNGTGYGSSPEWSTAAGGDSSDSAWGDFDGDGDLDFATADGNDGPKTAVNGGQMIASSSSWNDGQSYYTYSMDLADFDGDGDLDLAIGNDGGVSMVYKYEGGTYSAFWNTQTWRPHAEDILWFDYNLDGSLDVVIGDYDGKNIVFDTSSWLAQSSSPSWFSQTSDDTQDLVAGDINGDGRPDLVALNDGTNRVNLIAVKGQGFELSTQASWSSGDSMDSMCGALGDFDGDGDLDLFVANKDEVDQIFFNTGTALQTTAGWQSAATTTAQGCDVGDIDGDGDIDILVANENQQNQLYLNGGNGNFPTTPSWVSSQALDTVSIGLWDVDGDGDLDMVEGNYGLRNYIRINEGGSFTNTVWQSPGILDTWVVEMGDVDGDGDLDMVVGNEQQTNQLFLAEPDQDGDWVSEPIDEMPSDPTQTADVDDDGYGDRLLGWLPDSCSGYWGDSWRDRWGCPDLDQDGQSDLFDPFMQQPTQWSDIDLDGMGDNWANFSHNSYRSSRGLGEFVTDAYLPDPSPWDYDNDGYEDLGLAALGAQMPYDNCPMQDGTSIRDNYGCRDTDRDGWSDNGDSHPGDATQHRDTDGDGYGDNQSGSNPDKFPDDATQHADSDGDRHGDDPNGTDGDHFPFDATQWDDSDGDGYGDRHKGTTPDSCIFEVGNSSVDRYGCPDSDGDGWSDEGDLEPENELVWSDADGDGYDDQITDDCIDDRGTSTIDRQGCRDADGDGYSDADDQWDAHPDGYGDAFPDDESQWFDSDGDGYGNNVMGTEADGCPTEWGTSTTALDDGELVARFGCDDQDNDGMVDEDDDCPLTGGTSWLDRHACPDTDGDGVSDIADDCDLQPGDSTIVYIACPDADGDGIPDSIDPIPDDGNGTADDWDADGWPNPANLQNVTSLEDAFPSDPTQWLDSDGDGLGDNPEGSSPDLFPFDYDNDGVMDVFDPFPLDPREWSDFDGDGIGDNADTDDDNDGYPDILEINQLTDPLSASSHPTESWELIVPGTTIGLGAWDMIGILGGGPLAIWLAFGLLTRSGRTARYQQELESALTREALEGIAHRYEFSLMLRLIGPHQGIRLERLRAELDDELELLPLKMNQPLDTPITEVDQTTQVEAKMQGKEIPDLNQPASTAVGVVDDDGYEWVDHGGESWYRMSPIDTWKIYVDESGEADDERKTAGED